MRDKWMCSNSSPMGSLHGLALIPKCQLLTLWQTHQRKGKHESGDLVLSGSLYVGAFSFLGEDNLRPSEVNSRRMYLFQDLPVLPPLPGITFLRQ